MLKLETKSDKEKKERRNKLIIGIILVGLMVLSTAGYAFYGTTNTKTSKLTYNNIKFEKLDDGLWHFTINNYNFATQFNPEETENISVISLPSIQNYISKPVYFSQDSYSSAVSEISSNLGQFFQRTQFICLNPVNISDCGDYPIKNCSSNVIVIQESNKTLIRTQGNCTFIQASYEDLLRASDSFIYKTLGVQ